MNQFSKKKVYTVISAGWPRKSRFLDFLVFPCHLSFYGPPAISDGFRYLYPRGRAPFWNVVWRKIFDPIWLGSHSHPEPGFFSKKFFCQKMSFCDIIDLRYGLGLALNCMTTFFKKVIKSWLLWPKKFYQFLAVKKVNISWLFWLFYIVW